MITLTKKEFLEEKHVYFMQLKMGAVFVYPTDTIYGIGCDATNAEAVKRIRDIKRRDKKPFSVIAPSKDWIRENCEVEKKDLDRLPGPFTLILRLKNREVIAKDVNEGKETIGVRIPDHWISDMIKGYGKPVVTTSVNRAGDEPITEVKRVNNNKVDFAIDEGKIEGKPSTVIDLTGKDEKILRK